MRCYAYLRASTQEQDAQRARESLETFAKEKNLSISGWFVENESGAKLARPELFKLIELADPGDAILVEQVDRFSRLNAKDWSTLRSMVEAKRLRVVSLDLPTSNQFLSNGDEFTERVLQAINSLMLDILAAVARKDYEDRRRRQAQGIEKAKSEGRFKGRQPNQALHQKIQKLLDSGNHSWTDIQSLTGCSRATISKISKANKAQVAS